VVGAGQCLSVALELWRCMEAPRPRMWICRCKPTTRICRCRLSQGSSRPVVGLLCVSDGRPLIWDDA
jgi:hypothetical protein